MARSVLLGTAFGLVVFSLSSSAPADSPAPPFPYSEPCTPSRQQGPDEECWGCRPTHADPQRCERLLAGYGFTKRCETYEATMGEVWCRPLAAKAPALPAEVRAQLVAPGQEPGPSQQQPGASQQQPGQAEPGQVEPSARGCNGCSVRGVAKPPAELGWMAAALACARPWRRRKR